MSLSIRCVYCDKIWLVATDDDNQPVFSIQDSTTMNVIFFQNGELIHQRFNQLCPICGLHRAFIVKNREA